MNRYIEASELSIMNHIISNNVSNIESNNVSNIINNNVSNIINNNVSNIESNNVSNIINNIVSNGTRNKTIKINVLRKYKKYLPGTSFYLRNFFEMIKK